MFSPETPWARLTRRIDTRPRHFCVLFQHEGDQAEVLADFLRSGLSRREKALFVVDSPDMETFLPHLKRAGLPVGALMAGEQLEVMTVSEYFHPEVPFNTDAWVDDLAGRTLKALADGFNGFRMAADVSWTEQREQPPDLFSDYDAAVTKFASRHPFTALCLYDLRKTGPRNLQRALRRH